MVKAYFFLMYGCHADEIKRYVIIATSLIFIFLNYFSYPELSFDYQIK